MNNEIYESIKTALENASFSSLFEEVIGVPEEVSEDDDNKYALMFNVETEELFFLDYAHKGNSWNKTAESQNPWITAGFFSAEEVIDGNPDIYSYIDQKHEDWSYWNSQEN